MHDTEQIKAGDGYYACTRRRWEGIHKSELETRADQLNLI